jgi:hypothetical protein
MSSIIGRAVFRATPRLRDAGVNAGKSAEPAYKKAAQASKDAGGEALRQGAKKDPELYVCPSGRTPFLRYQASARF